MAFDIGTADRNNALQIIANPRNLPAGLKAALRSELLTDPAGRGYVGKTDKEVLVLLCSPYTVPNPIQPQPRVNRAAGNMEVRELVQAIRAKGLMTDPELREVLTHPDPTWTATVPAEPRSETVLGRGIIPALSEIAEARA